MSTSIIKRIASQWLLARGKAKKDVGHGGLDEWFSGHGQGRSKSKGKATWGDWVAISPVRRKFVKTDGSKKQVQPGDIVGPCGISKTKEWKEFTRDGQDPLKCMPRQKAYELSKKERADIAKGKLKAERKDKESKSPTRTKTFKDNKTSSLTEHRHHARFGSEGWVGSAVIVRNDKGEVMLLRRGQTAPWMPGKWNLPGGTVDAGENPAEAAVREAHEEAGIRIDPKNVSLVDSITFPDGVAHFYEAESFEGEPKINWENDKLDWVSQEKLKDYDLVPGLDQALSKSFERGAGESTKDKNFQKFLTERYQQGRRKVKNPNKDTGREEISVSYLLKRYPDSSQADAVRREYESWSQKQASSFCKRLKKGCALTSSYRRIAAQHVLSKVAQWQDAAQGEFKLQDSMSPYDALVEAVKEFNAHYLEACGRQIRPGELMSALDAVLNSQKDHSESLGRWS